MSTITVLLVDDHALVRAGFRLILDAESGVEVVGEAGDGAEAILAVERLRPDVVLMDIQMPRMDGLEATRRIVQTAATTRVIILTTFERDDYIFEALRAGASGFLLKNAPPDELVHAVRVVAGGDALLAPSITRKVIEGYVRRPAADPAHHAALGRLTDREREILVLLAGGKSNAELAVHLFLGEGTIKTHVSNMLTKLGLRDRVQAVVFAYESGLVEPGHS